MFSISEILQTPELRCAIQYFRAKALLQQMGSLSGHWLTAPLGRVAEVWAWDAVILRYYSGGAARPTAAARDKNHWTLGYARKLV